MNEENQPIKEKIMGINDLNRNRKADTTIAGVGCLVLVLNLAWISLLVWAIIRLVLHFT